MPIPISELGRRYVAAPIALATLAITAPVTRAAAQGTIRDGITRALDRSAAAWNAGDLERFMAVYLDSDRTTYATASRYLHGRKAIAAHYAPQFAKGAMRDSLRLEDITVDSLAPTVAHVMAFYVLARNDSTTARGPASLLMERVHGMWRIVHDHSS